MAKRSSATNLDDEVPIAKKPRLTDKVALPNHYFENFEKIVEYMLATTCQTESSLTKIRQEVEDTYRQPLTEQEIQNVDTLMTEFCKLNSDEMYQLKSLSGSLSSFQRFGPAGLRKSLKQSSLVIGSGEILGFIRKRRRELVPILYDAFVKIWLTNDLSRDHHRPDWTFHHDVLPSCGSFKPNPNNLFLSGPCDFWFVSSSMAAFNNKMPDKIQYFSIDVKYLVDGLQPSHIELQEDDEKSVKYLFVEIARDFTVCFGFQKSGRPVSLPAQWAIRALRVFLELIPMSFVFFGLIHGVYGIGADQSKRQQAETAFNSMLDKQALRLDYVARTIDENLRTMPKIEEDETLLAKMEPVEANFANRTCDTKEWYRVKWSKK